MYKMHSYFHNARKIFVAKILPYALLSFPIFMNKLVLLQSVCASWILSKGCPCSIASTCMSYHRIIKWTYTDTYVAFFH